MDPKQKALGVCKRSGLLTRGGDPIPKFVAAQMTIKVEERSYSYVLTRVKSMF
jgi:hypothetical protein